MPTPDGQETANELWLAALLRHQIALLRLSSGITKKIISILDDTEADLRAEIERRVAALAGTDLTKSASLNRLEFLRKAIIDVRSAAHAKLQNELTKQITNLTKAEPIFAAAQLDKALPVDLDYAFPDVSRLKTLVSKKPFEGKTLKEWAKKIEKDDIDRIVQQVKVGVVQGEGTADISKRIIGTVSMKGKNGITEVTRQQAQSLVRTATNFFANQAKAEFFQENSDIIKEEMFVATLDARTTAQCRALDGKRFPLGEGPRPPLHFNCRSVRVAIIDDKVIGERPMSSFTEKEALRRYTQAEGLDPVSSRDDLPRGTKGDFDEFAAKMKRQMTGRTPATTSYQEFLSKQSAQFQDDVLGKTKGKLFRKGNLTVEKFVDRAGNELTLEDLANQYPEAFRKAGLDPKDFR